MHYSSLCVCVLRLIDKQFLYLFEFLFSTRGAHLVTRINDHEIKGLEIFKSFQNVVYRLVLLLCSSIFTGGMSVKKKTSQLNSFTLLRVQRNLRLRTKNPRFLHSQLLAACVLRAKCMRTPTLARCVLYLPTHTLIYCVHCTLIVVDVIYVRAGWNCLRRKKSR